MCRLSDSVRVSRAERVSKIGVGALSTAVKLRNPTNTRSPKARQSKPVCSVSAHTAST